jgi:hypothetical protein
VWWFGLCKWTPLRNGGYWCWHRLSTRTRKQHLILSNFFDFWIISQLFMTKVHLLSLWYWISWLQTLNDLRGCWVTYLGTELHLLYLKAANTEPQPKFPAWPLAYGFQTQVCNIGSCLSFQSACLPVWQIADLPDGIIMQANFSKNKSINWGSSLKTPDWYLYPNVCYI